MEDGLGDLSAACELGGEACVGGGGDDGCVGGGGGHAGEDDRRLTGPACVAVVDDELSIGELGEARGEVGVAEGCLRGSGAGGEEGARVAGLDQGEDLEACAAEVGLGEPGGADARSEVEDEGDVAAIREGSGDGGPAHGSDELCDDEIAGEVASVVEARAVLGGEDVELEVARFDAEAHALDLVEHGVQAAGHVVGVEGGADGEELPGEGVDAAGVSSLASGLLLSLQLCGEGGAEVIEAL